MEVPEALLGFHPPFDRSMILLKKVIQVLDGSMATSRAQHAFLLNGWPARFLREFQERLAKFGLELHSDKTRLIEFGRLLLETESGVVRESRKPSRFLV